MGFIMGAITVDEKDIKELRSEVHGLKTSYKVQEQALNTIAETQKEMVSIIRDQRDYQIKQDIKNQQFEEKDSQNAKHIEVLYALASESKLKHLNLTYKLAVVIGVIAYLFPGVRGLLPF